MRQPALCQCGKPATRLLVTPEGRSWKCVTHADTFVREFVKTRPEGIVPDVRKAPSRPRRGIRLTQEAE